MTGGHHHLRVRLCGALCLAFLGGCAAEFDWDAVRQQSALIRASCASQHPDSKVAAEQCANGPIRALYVSGGFPDMDVIDAYLAHREVIAAWQDSRAISPQQARADYADALAQENTLLLQRRASRAEISAATMPMFCDDVGFHSMICD
jgi:hypothetical protein